MSQYTTELRYLVEQGYELELNKYPIFDENYREVLNKKIIDEYYFREIGVETPARFKHHLNHTMDMIMPYYNQLYESELLEIDPLLSFRETEELKRKTDVDNSSDRVDTQGETRATTNDQTGTQEQNQSSDRVTTAKGGEKVSNTMGGSNVTEGETMTTTIGTETTDQDSTDTKTENSLSVTSDTPGGMLSVGDLKTHTWASSATMNEGTTTNIGTDDKVVDKDETVTGIVNQTVTQDVTVTGTLNQTDTQDGTSSSNATSNTDENEHLNIGGLVTDSKKSTEGSEKIGVALGSAKGTINTVDEYIKTKFGVAGHQANLLKEYRSTFLNIDRMIVNELSALFMGVY